MTTCTQEGQICERREPEECSRICPLWLAASLFVVSGVATYLVIKLQDRTAASLCRQEHCESQHFRQPLIQCFTMFLGESLCFPIYALHTFVRNKRRREDMSLEFGPSLELLKKPPCPLWWWALPPLWDMMASTCRLFAMSTLQGSTVIMLSDGSLMCTTILEMTILRRPLRLHELVGILLLSASTAVTALASSPDPKTYIKGNQTWLAVVVALVAVVLTSLQIVVEEWLLERLRTPPLLAVGAEGVFGLGYTLTALLVGQYFGFTDLKHSWRQMTHTAGVVGYNGFFIVLVCVFNAAGLTVTKLGSGLLREVCAAFRGPVTWLIEIAIGWASFSALEFTGLPLTLLGFLFYIFFLPGINDRHSPRLYRLLRWIIPCFCTSARYHHETAMSHKANDEDV